jgi:hypothetical protein
MLLPYAICCKFVLCRTLLGSSSSSSSNVCIKPDSSSSSWGRAVLGAKLQTIRR